MCFFQSSIDMPELPEVETIARQLDERISGRRVVDVFLHRGDILHGEPGPLCALLKGRRVQSVRRRAKRIFLKLSPRGSLVFHLGMSGRLTLVPQEDSLEAHTHLCLDLSGGSEQLRFRDPRRFGGVWFDNGGEVHVGRRLGRLGAEPLELAPAKFRAMLDRKRQIKALLLDQTIIAGLGNIYCDESLHRAGIHPTAVAQALDPAARDKLLRSIKTILKRAIKFNGTTFMDYRSAEGAPGSFQKYHRVYHREGQACKGCDTMIERIKVAGRSSFVCPACQPAA